MLQVETIRIVSTINHLRTAITNGDVLIIIDGGAADAFSEPVVAP
jgi:hypothetical protein